ncbi:TPA: hypothetical protein RG697_002829 [Morganella morganii]|uniref:hypothetical protein n=1 Tax=Morganella morganii TaxID=582 RepID=UPI001BDB5DBB|nr:hypothetical protein [Morganella morganii]MBT0382654.1 hypothetical protein [Morganella morganii subsp. morganii]HDU8611200.1 hypothetical protein [Morganella morganii]
MNIEMIVSVVSMVSFFLSFFFYERKKKAPLTSSKAMNDFFSGVLFLRENNINLIVGRCSVFLGIPISYFIVCVRNKYGIECLPSIISLWNIAIYFFIYSSVLGNREVINRDFFISYLFLMGKKNLEFINGALG